MAGKEYIVDIGDEAIEAGSSFAEAVHWADLAVNAPAGQEIILKGGRHGVTADAAVVVERDVYDEEHPEAEGRPRRVYATWKRAKDDDPDDVVVCGTSDPYVIQKVYEYVMGRSRSLPPCGIRGTPEHEAWLRRAPRATVGRSLFMEVVAAPAKPAKRRSR